jgi:uncharacterized Tic20 family protein
MKAIRSILLAILASAGIVALISEPADNVDFLTALIASKLIGAILLIVVVILAQRWHKNGKIYDYEQFCDD